MNNFFKSFAAYILLFSALYSCSVTSHSSNTTHTQKIIINPIRQQPQLAEYTLSSNIKISGKAESEGSIMNGPTVDMVKKEAIYNALKTNSADLLVQGMYKATVTDAGKTRHITVEVTGFAGKYTNISPFTPENARALAIADTIRYYIGTQPTHDDSVWQWDLNHNNAAPEALAAKPEEPVIRGYRKSEPEKEITPQEINVEKPAPVKVEEAKEMPANGQEKAAVKEENNANSNIEYHTVLEGEDVNSIVKQYGITRDEFASWNYLPDGLKPGINVVVKFGEAKTKPEAKKAMKQPVSAATGTKYHVVAAGETLYHISQVYHVTVQQIKDWNHLSGNTVAVGQNLLVGK